MAAIDDLIEQISNKLLQEKIKKEVKKIQQNKKFGLVFEDHEPECTPLYDVKIRVGSKVALRGSEITNVLIVENIIESKATCIDLKTNNKSVYFLSDLAVVAEFGDPIYPYLKFVDSVSTNPESDLWHELIEADNYHALQLLSYIYANKIDCIYIDPPYNTGAKDWKYNNNYVDSSDSYKHSKWLSFIEKRLKLCKKLLNPENSTLIVTIDEKEYIYLGSLLKEMFPQARMQMITSVINPKGVSRSGEFSRVDEYIYILMFGEAKPCQTSDSMLALENDIKSGKQSTGTIWLPLKRSGSSSLRTDRPNLFYPVYIDKATKKVRKIGEPVPQGISAEDVQSIDGCITLLPIKKNGVEGRWQLQASTVIKGLKEGTVKIKEKGNGQFVIQYLNEGAKKEIKTGSLKICGKENTGALVVKRVDNKLTTAKSVWNKATHDATTYGTNLLKSILLDRVFPYPKSLYAVRDILNFFVGSNKEAIILDFFAGSGTTLQAVNLLNQEDNGHRKCIIVTNNEVSEEDAAKFREQGLGPEDNVWNSKGIAQYITWPRTKCTIIGEDIEGHKLKDEYLTSGMKMEDGFMANAVYFKLGFLDKDSVALGVQFSKLLPILWMKTGAIGKCPEVEARNLQKSYIFYKNKFAVLLDEKEYKNFKKVVNSCKNIVSAFIVTDSDSGYHEMISGLNVEHTYQLYKDYLDNFRINAKE